MFYPLYNPLCNASINRSLQGTTNEMKWNVNNYFLTNQQLHNKRIPSDEIRHSSCLIPRIPALANLYRICMLKNSAEVSARSTQLEGNALPAVGAWSRSWQCIYEKTCEGGEEWRHIPNGLGAIIIIKRINHRCGISEGCVYWGGGGDGDEWMKPCFTTSPPDSFIEENL